VTESAATVQRAILDTSVAIADQVRPIPGVLAISAISLAELNFGVLVAKTTEVRAERLRRLSLLQQRFDALSVDEAVSVSYGRLADRSPRRPMRTVRGCTPGTFVTSPVSRASWTSSRRNTATSATL
jgi:predicted nucleic acid-binding protein